MELGGGGVDLKLWLNGWVLSVQMPIKRIIANYLLYE